MWQMWKSKENSPLSHSIFAPLQESRRRLAAATRNTNTAYMAQSVLMERTRIKFGTNNDITGHQTIRLLLCCESAHVSIYVTPTRFARTRELEGAVCVSLSLSLSYFTN